MGNPGSLDSTSQRRRHPCTTDMRQICNAIYYHLKTGCQWNMLPGDFPLFSTVYNYYRKWQCKGVWEKLNHTLRGKVRLKLGKSTQKSALAKLAVGITADNQSIRTTRKKGSQCVGRAMRDLFALGVPLAQRLCQEKGSNWPGCVRLRWR